MCRPTIRLSAPPAASAPTSGIERQLGRRLKLCIASRTIPVKREIRPTRVEGGTNISPYRYWQHLELCTFVPLRAPDTPPSPAPSSAVVEVTKSRIRTCQKRG